MECPICYETIQLVNSCTTPCGHSFCFNCMIQALQQNGTCPCCRAPLVENKDQEDPEEDDDDDDSTIDSNFEVNDPEETQIEIEKVVESFSRLGYDLKDAISLLLCRYSRTDPKYTRQYISDLNDGFDEMMEDLESERFELEGFAAEDRDAGKVC